MNDLDLSSCENEPIRFPGSVQPHGGLLVIDPKFATIIAASESCNLLLGLSAPNLLGLSFGKIFGLEAESRLLTSQHDADQPLLRLQLDNKEFDATPHVNSNGQIVLDVEMAERDVTPSVLFQHRRAIQLLRRFTDLASITQQAVTLFQNISGFDRVMIYRFDEAWNGEVIAENCLSGAESFLGLNFPASDIPKQARDLFQSSRVRQIPDVLYTPSALISMPDCSTIDLGPSNLRSVSPIHIEYLQNMGVRASLVGALTVAGQLWGLLTCHHINAPKYFSTEQRMNFSWFCQDLEALIDAALLRERQEREKNLAMKRRTLINAVRAQEFKSLINDEHYADIIDVVTADGFALIIDDSILTCGITPESERIQDLLQRRWLLGKNANVFSSSALNSDFALDKVGDSIAGALFVSVREHPATSMIWFRRERSYAVQWGGDPENAHFTDTNGRITPRKSFALFLQNVSGQSRPWSQEELDSAVELAALIDIETTRKEQAFAQTILDSSPDNIAILDNQGSITLVNNAWSRFAAENGAPTLAAKSIGQNYRIACTASEEQENGAEAILAWSGIEAVLTKKLDHFKLDYPCDSPDEPRWFKMHVYPMISPCEGVAVVHENVTATKLAELRLAKERNLLRTMLETIPDLVWLKDANGIYQLCNPAFERFFGACEVDIVGKSDHDFMTFELADLFRHNDAAAMTASAPVVNEEWLSYGGNNRQVLFEITKTAMRDSQGNIIGVLSVGRDITARRTAQQLLESQSKKNAELLKAASDGVHILDQQGNILEFSQSFADMLGYSHEEAAKLKAVDFDVLTSKGQSSDYVKRLLSGLKRFETTYRRKDGTIIDVEIHASGVEISGNRYVFASARDITPQKESKRQLLELNQRYMTLFMDSPDAYLILEIDRGRITDCNHAAESMLRGSREQIIGLTPDQLCPAYQPNGKTSLETATEKIAETLQQGRNRFECVHRRFDQSDFWAEVTITLINYDNRKVFFVAWRDISIRKQLELSLHEEQIALETANNKLSVCQEG